MFRKVFGVVLGAALFVAPMVASAELISDKLDLKGLTAEQIEQLKASAQSLKDEAAKKVKETAKETVDSAVATVAPTTSTAKEVVNAAKDLVPTRNDLKNLASLGGEIGIALGQTAKELGIAVNEFIGTPLGMIATFIIVYKLIGAAIIKFVFGTAFLIIGNVLWFRYFKILCVYDNYEKEPTEIKWWGWTKYKITYSVKRCSEAMAFGRIGMIALLVILNVIGFAMVLG